MIAAAPSQDPTDELAAILERGRALDATALMVVTLLAQARAAHVQDDREKAFRILDEALALALTRGHFALAARVAVRTLKLLEPEALRRHEADHWYSLAESLLRRSGAGEELWARRDRRGAS